ncbi:hypothetical protein, partial [Pseudomonas saxonica]|uniref:hypothetical protein n=1 Tax=Pseudomonas saxonica TaxID=2600598 RepID=UPI001F3E28AD
EYEVSSLAFEFSGKDTTLLGHLTPRYGEHSRLNECPVSLDHYTLPLRRFDNAGRPTPISDAALVTVIPAGMTSALIRKPG